MCTAVKLRGWFVECDMTVFTDTEKLKVNAACCVYCFVVFLAHLVGIFGNTGGNTSIIDVDVDLFKEVLVHEVTVALVVVGCKTEIFVKVEGTNL